VLIGVEGLGKMALSRLAIHICQYQIRELKLTAEFSRDDWQALIKAMFESTAIDKRVNVLNICDNQMADDIIMVDLNCLLKNGDLPDLLHASEKSGFLERIRSTMPQSKLGGTAPPDSSVYTEMINRTKKNFKSIINLTPTGKTLKKELKNYQSIVNCSTIIWMD
jgi:dynein heavy chain, axonemal